MASKIISGQFNADWLTNELSQLAVHLMALSKDVFHHCAQPQEELIGPCLHWQRLVNPALVKPVHHFLLCGVFLRCTVQLKFL